MKAVHNGLHAPGCRDSRARWCRVASKGRSIRAVPRLHEVCVQTHGRLRLAARHQMPVAIEGDRDAGVADVGGERLGVYPRRDHHRGEGVAALVKADRLKANGLPALVGSRRQGRRVAELVACVREDALLRTPAVAEPLLAPAGDLGGGQHRHPADDAEVVGVDLLRQRRWLDRAQAKLLDDADDLGRGGVA